MSAALNPEDDLLAAELALRLLDGDALAAARDREARDPAFAAAVASWNEALAPLLDGADVAPDAGVWTRIATSLALQRPDTNVVALGRKVRFWRTATAGLTALAASFAIILGVRALDSAPPATAPAATSGETLIATVVPEGAPAMAVIAFERTSKSLIVTPAALTPVPGRSHELWVVPATGDPRSLGLIAPGAARRIALADDLAGLFGSQATLAISAEQEGGSRTGSPGGPIVATGKLRRV